MQAWLAAAQLYALEFLHHTTACICVLYAGIIYPETWIFQPWPSSQMQGVSCLHQGRCGVIYSRWLTESLWPSSTLIICSMDYTVCKAIHVCTHQKINIHFGQKVLACIHKVQNSCTAQQQVSVKGDIGCTVSVVRQHTNTAWTRWYPYWHVVILYIITDSCTHAQTGYSKKPLGQSRLYRIFLERGVEQ